MTADQIVIAFGHHVRRLRETLGWSQQTLADATRTSQGLISRLEGGCTGVSFVNALAITRALADAVPALEGAVSPTVHALLAVAHELPPIAEPVPDPGLAQVLRTYHRLSPPQQQTFLRITRPILGLMTHTERTA